MIFAEPVLTEDLRSAQGRIFNNMLRMCDMYTWKKDQAFSQETNLYSRQRGSYIRTMASKRKSQVLNLKELCPKTK
jgi:hypothetical protein